MSTSDFDTERCRAQFPGLDRKLEGRPVVFLDGPAGSQVPARVIAAVTRYLGRTNANAGGAFATSRESDALIAEARRAIGELLGTDDPHRIVFGPNMTSLAWSLAHALARTWKPGDEIVVTRLEHDANFTPWVRAAAEAGATVRYVPFHLEDCTLDMAAFESAIGPRTRFVAVGAASNAVGTLNPVGRVVQLAHAVGARVFVDAVHHVPHRMADVQAWGCDFLACSAYKFFAPRGVGVLYAREEALDALPAYKLLPATDDLPGRWESGALCHEGIAGTLAAIEYLAELGRGPTVHDRRSMLQVAYREIELHERSLAVRLLEGLGALDGWRVHGLADPARVDERVPTVSITHERRRPDEIAEALGRRGIFVWRGNYYALPVTEALGLEPQGMVRLGLLHYNTVEEVDRVLEALGELA